MAGMFYSLKEAAEKLNITEQEVKELAKDGKLREFRDGSNLLFKVDEVETLMSDAKIMIPEEPPASSKRSKRPKRAKKVETSAEAGQEPIELEELTEPLAAAEPEEVFGPEAITEEPPTAEESAIIDEDISLAPETGVPAVESELTDADTALTGEGISVLGETDRDYAVTDDTMAETTATTEPTGTTPEAPLEELEEDVNLDSLGSGSGLLDLSLQADDTSLGGILDEIYTAEGGERPEPPGAGTAEEMATEADHILSEEELTIPEPAATMAPVMARAIVEPEPDVQSKTLGMLLFLPLLVLVYTTVVAVAGMKGVMPSILSAIQGAIWYILIGAFVVTAAVVGATFLLTGNLGTGAKREKKPKKQKKAKETAPEEEAS